MENRISGLKQWPIVLAIIVYGIAHGGILFLSGIYWDDWGLYNVNGDILIDKFHQLGIPWIGYLHSFLLSFDHGVTFYRITVFVCYLFSGLFLLSILSRIKEINPTAKLFIVLIFMTFPVNSARVALIDTPYALCYFSFFFGFWLLSSNTKGSILIRILSLVLFFFSFSTNSILMFYAVVGLFILYIENVRIFSIMGLIKAIFKNIDYILLPFLFWIIKNIFWVPYGLYAGYNKITGDSLKEAVSIIPYAFNRSFTDVLRVSFGHLDTTFVFVLILTVIMSVLMMIYISRSQVESKNNYFHSIILLLLGTLFFGLAVYPYIVVEEIPKLEDWSSRHQLLVPLGISLLLYYGLSIIWNLLRVGRKIQIALFSFLIVIFISSNLLSYFDFQKDWYKQLSLIENFRDNETIANNSTFIFRDLTPGLNVNDRTYRFYEYTGLLKEAFHEEKRFGESVQVFKRKNRISRYNRFFNEHYNLADYAFTEPIYLVTIYNGSTNLYNKVNVMKLMYHQLFNKELFKQEIKKVIDLEIDIYK